GRPPRVQRARRAPAGSPRIPPGAPDHRRPGALAHLAHGDHPGAAGRGRPHGTVTLRRGRGSRQRARKRVRILSTPDPRPRCPWPHMDELYIAYHDREWGVPVHNDRRLFEFLILESAQAGLSWRTILGKREGYRRAFAGFD